MNASFEETAAAREKERREGEERGLGVSSAAVFSAMNRTIPEDAIIAVDVGNNT